MGARPAWFLATALLPPGAPDSLPAAIFNQITSACEALEIELVGGHTEITIGLDRPIIIGAMLGKPRGMRSCAERTSSPATSY